MQGRRSEREPEAGGYRSRQLNDASLLATSRPSMGQMGQPAGQMTRSDLEVT